MNIKINPITRLIGEITAPGSKSYSHRVFVAASLAEGVSVIKKPMVDGDVKITIESLKKLGVKIIKITEDTYIVEKKGNLVNQIDQIIDCENSGTTIRIFSALSLIVDGGLTLTGEFLKKKRPILPLLNALKELGAEFKLTDKTLHIQRSNNKCNIIKISGIISSQFITALLMICPLIICEKKDYIIIDLLTSIASYPYIEITKNVINSFGIYIQEKLNYDKKGKYYITCGQHYKAQMFDVPGDFSSMAFIISAAVLSLENSKIVINNLDFKKPQGDEKLIEILRKMGANIEKLHDKNRIIVNGNLRKYPLTGKDIDIRDIPDLFPILSIIGAFAKGKTKLYNAANLRFKESDRISVVARELKKMGVKVEEEDDTLTIYYCDKLNGSVINHENDHRIAMSFTIAALYAKSSSEIHDIEIVRDSYPKFIEDLKNLGANFE